MLWIDGVAATVPTGAQYAQASPYVLRAKNDGWGIYADGERLASAEPFQRPHYYDLTTADGIPYWKIALLHLDSLASTVVQTCVWWGTDDQCGFCGIELSLEAGRTIPVKKPHHLAEVAAAAKQLDGAVDVTKADRRINQLGPGDFLFAPAGVVHRFEKFTDDLVVWVLFYGPEGGEKS